MSFVVNSWADLSRAIVLADAAGAIGRTSPWRALRDGRIAFLPMPAEMSSTKLKRFARLTAGKSAVALIGDDDDLNRGPAGWPVAACAVAWVRSIIVHAAGRKSATTKWRSSRRNSSVGCLSSNAAPRLRRLGCAWCSQQPCVNCLGARHSTANGGVHPAPLDQSVSNECRGPVWLAPVHHGRRGLSKLCDDRPATTGVRSGRPGIRVQQRTRDRGDARGVSRLVWGVWPALLVGEFNCLGYDNHIVAAILDGTDDPATLKALSDALINDTGWKRNERASAGGEYVDPFAMNGGAKARIGS